MGAAGPHRSTFRAAGEMRLVPGPRRPPLARCCAIHEAYEVVRCGTAVADVIRERLDDRRLLVG